VSADLLTPESGVVRPEWSFFGAIAQRVMNNEDIAKRFFDDEEFRQALIDWYAEQVYRKAREG